MAEKASETTDSLDGSVTHLLHRASQLADEAVKSELEKLKVTPRQFALLIAIEANSGATQVELVAVSGIDRSTMAEMTRRLVVRGLIEKNSQSGDGRASALKLTPAGRRLLKQCRSAVQAAEESFLEQRLSASRQKSIMTILTALIAGPKANGRTRRAAKSTD